MDLELWLQDGCMKQMSFYVTSTLECKEKYTDICRLQQQNESRQA
jgi:hypothetical protein